MRNLKLSIYAATQGMRDNNMRNLKLIKGYRERTSYNSVCIVVGSSFTYIPVHVYLIIHRFLHITHIMKTTLE